jgi:Na+/H+ antiporter NhaD/arsenite permease-like protein
MRRLARERIDMRAWEFLRVGVMAMPPTLILAVARVALTMRG